MSLLSRFLISLVVVSAAVVAALTIQRQVGNFAEGIGYIGPACAVVDGSLYIHGIIVRSLNNSELSEFERYQAAISRLKKLQDSASNEGKKVQWQLPQMPAFCYGMPDTTEVVLKGCVVRDGHVFVKGKLIRPLNSLERTTVSSLLTRRSRQALLLQQQAQLQRPYALFFNRRKRSAETNNTKPGSSGTDVNDLGVAELLEKFLRVNSTVAKRFLPVAKMSPLFNELSQQNAAKMAQKPSTDPTNRRMRDFPDDFGYNPAASVSAFGEEPYHRMLPSLTPLPEMYHSPEGEFDAGFDAFPDHMPFDTEVQMPGVNQPNSPMTNAFVYGNNGGESHLQPIGIPGNVRPGDTMMIGGKQYVAVSVNDLAPDQLSGLGNIYGSHQPGVGGSQTPTNYGSFVDQPHEFGGWQHPVPPTGAAAAPSTQEASAFGQTFAAQPKVRFHPSRPNDVSQAALNAGLALVNQMPHQICTAHIANPFWFLQK